MYESYGYGDRPPGVEGRAAVSPFSFFTPSSNSEEDGKEEEAKGDDHHIYIRQASSRFLQGPPENPQGGP